MSTEECSRLRVNREEAFAAAVRCLQHSRQNVFVWGVRGIGKTFLLRLIEEALRDSQQLLPVQIDILGLPGFGRLDATTAFPEAVLLGLCAGIWRDIVQRPYSELRATLDLRQGDLEMDDEVTRVVRKVYAQVMASQRKARFEYSNSIGFSAGAKGEKKEVGWVEQEQPPILPFEFFELSSELLVCLRKRGISGLVAMCDEANHLALRQQREILSRYVDLFTSQGVQFVFVAGTPEWQPEAPNVPEGFDLVIALNELSNEHGIRLVESAAGLVGIKLEAAAINEAIRALGGNPRMLLQAVQGVAYEAQNGVTSGAPKTVDQELMAGICRRVKAAHSEHIERLRLAEEDASSS